MSSLTLYTYFRSSAAYRVRIGLNLKGLDYQAQFIHLVKEGGEQHQFDYRHINPQGLIPALAIDSQADILTQSLAILEYLEEKYPEPPLLPTTAEQRALVRSLALMVCCDIHPLNNLRVHNYLKKTMHINNKDLLAWYQHWIREGLNAIETRLAAHRHHSPYCYGDTPTLADLCLIPQMYNALRFNCDISHYPILRNIYNNCLEIEAFSKAAPENQPDSE